jgi:hypothetical protein
VSAHARTGILPLISIRAGTGTCPYSPLPYSVVNIHQPQGVHARHPRSLLTPSLAPHAIMDLDHLDPARDRDGGQIMIPVFTRADAAPAWPMSSMPPCCCC